jgi:putative ABC transport system permease protein
MRTATGLKLALNITLHSKLRSWLTILGIVIGVAAVVAIVSIGQGLQQNVQSRLSGQGEDLITLSAGGRAAFGGFRGPGGGGDRGGGGATSANITKKDIQIVQGIPNVKYVEGMVSGRTEVYYLGEKAQLSVTGVDSSVWQYVTTSKLAAGRMLSPSDTGVVVIGTRIFNGTFKQPININRQLDIEGKSFKIVGILQDGEENNNIFMPIHDARQTIPAVSNTSFNSVVVKVASVDAIDQVMADADARLTISRHVANKKKDYTLTSSKAQAQRFSDVTSTMTIFLAAIAAVSLIVGAVGIANTMFTAVLEKTREIGIMKAIGAKNRDIMLVFMLNAAMVGFVGGLIGITLGSAISLLLPSLGIRLIGAGGGGDITTALTPGLLIGSLLLAIGLGVVSGVIPAYRASKLRPVDALRY